jgi:hypothetical protein
LDFLMGWLGCDLFPVNENDSSVIRLGAVDRARRREAGEHGFIRKPTTIK